MSQTLTGGCQCGAVRFAVSELGQSSVCHCRMCQKAFGSLFASLVTGHDIKWTRDEPKWFASSNLAKRGFCQNCGTPLAYDTKYGLELAVGAFDQPDKIAPILQVNTNDKLACYDALSSLPIQQDPSDEWVQFLGCIKSYQHPDHETKDWTPKTEENKS